MISCSVVDNGDRQAGMFGIPIQLGISDINNACVTQLFALQLPKVCQHCPPPNSPIF